MTTCKEWNEKVDALNEQLRVGSISNDGYEDALNKMFGELISFTAKRPKEVCHE